MIAGGDGTKAGWIAAIDCGDGHVCVEPFQALAGFAARKDIHLVVIDVPIGLLERGTREADEEARALLKNRACCVFTAPIRPILNCVSREAASDKWQAIEGKRCTKQLWGIIQKVRDVDEMLRKTPRLRKKVYEGHPEVSFAVARGGRAIQEKKKDASGKRFRLNSLDKCLRAEAESWLRRESNSLHSDILDAFVVLWTAKRIENGSFKSFPEGLGEDVSFGMKAQIVA